MYENLDRDFNNFKGHQLIGSYEFDRDWPSWEIHPHGDEVVILLSGSAIFLLDRNNVIEEIALNNAGEYVVVPKNTWHTAHIKISAKMLFITPGENTQNKDIQNKATQ